MSNLRHISTFISILLLLCYVSSLITPRIHFNNGHNTYIRPINNPINVEPSDNPINNQINDQINDQIIRLSTRIHSTPPSNPPPSSNISPTTSTTTSILLLFLTTLIWGTQHSVIKIAVESSTDPASFSAARFAIGGAVAAVPAVGILARGKNDREEIEGNHGGEAPSLLPTPTTLRSGLLLGFYLLLGYSFQSISLLTTTASRSAFLLYLNVKFVPLFEYFIEGKSIKPSVWISALVAVIGTTLLCVDDVGVSTIGSFNTGDLWSIAAAAASAMFIITLEKSAKNVQGEEQTIWLNAVSINVVAVGALLWSVVGHMGSLSLAASDLQSTFLDNVTPLLYLGIVTTALANYLQTKGQKGVSASTASLIFALDPVWGAAFANIILGERLGILGVFGAGLITVAASQNAIEALGSGEENIEDAAVETTGNEKK